MKKLLIVTVTVAVTLFFVMSSGIRAEESSCFQKKDGWILRVYTEGTGPFALSLVVLDKTGGIVPPANIVGLSAVGNPYLFESNALNPDLSISCDDYVGTVYVMHDRSGQTFLTTIADIAAAQSGTPVLQVNPTLLSFGSASVGTTKTMSATVSNGGDADLHITSVSSPALPFSKTGDTCAGATLIPAGSCSVTIRFAPTGLYAYNGSFAVNSDGGNVTVNLSGTGISGGVVPPPR